MSVNENDLAENDHHQHHHHQAYLLQQRMSANVTALNENKLHRSKEIENLNLITQEEENEKLIEKSDLINHKSHMTRTNEVENLNELANDD